MNREEVVIGNDARNSLANPSALRFSAFIIRIGSDIFPSRSSSPSFSFAFLRRASCYRFKVFSLRNTFIDEALYPGICHEVTKKKPTILLLHVVRTRSTSVCTKAKLRIDCSCLPRDLSIPNKRSIAIRVRLYVPSLQYETMFRRFAGSDRKCSSNGEFACPNILRES